MLRQSAKKMTSRAFYSRKSDEKSNPVSWGKDFLPRSTSDHGLLFLNGSYDLCELGLGIGIILGGLSDPGKVLESELILVLGSQPSRGFLHEWNDAGHDSDWYELEADGDPPLNITTSWVDECDTIGDPV